MRTTEYNKQIFDEVAGKYAAQTYWRSDEEAISGYLKGLTLVGGCGAGRTLAPLRAKGLGIVAVDISPAMVSECRAKGEPALVMDIQKTSFEDNEFDSIFLPFHTICYVDSVEETLEEMHRILKPGGVLIISAANRFALARIRKTHSVGPETRLRWHYFSMFSTAMLKRYFKEVRCLGRAALQNDSYWKERILQYIPFLDKSLYFVCVK